VAGRGGSPLWLRRARLVSPREPESIPRTLQSLGRRYVRHVNAAYRRTGTLWEGRYRAAPIDSESYFLVCCRYIELNPVRAGMVAHPRDYPWSSWRAHARGADDPLVAGHRLYRALGRSAKERQSAYRQLFRAALDPEVVDALRAATNGGWALGGERFKRQIAKALGRRVAPLARGRPRKERADRRQLNLL
jgi:putative transposase